MRLTFALIGVCGCLLAGGCATSYDVVKVGPDSYLVSAVAAPARGGIDGARQKADETAAAKCQSLGKSPMVTNINTVHEYPATDRALLTFTCS